MVKPFTFTHIGDLSMKTDFGFHFDDGHWIIEWGGYEYPIEDERINSPLDLLEWIAHMGEKEWTMEMDNLSMFIQRVCKRKGWDLWGNGA